MAPLAGLLIFTLVMIMLWELEFLQKPTTAFITALVLLVVVLLVWRVAGTALANIPTANVIQHELPIQTNY